MVPKLLWLSAVALMMAPPPSSAEVVKCTTRSGLPLYQNFPCEFDSLGTVPSQFAAAKPTARFQSSIQAAARSVPAASTVTSRTRGVGPTIGMTADEVRTLWGEPEEVVQDEPRSGGAETWQYADGRVVLINQKQRVMSVQP
jgi:hypothetical protein